MKQIRISDTVIRDACLSEGRHLTFKEKLEIAKWLERLRVSVIELGPVTSVKSDALLLKSLAGFVGQATVALSVGLDGTLVPQIWDAASNLSHPRLQVTAPLSPARMEYVCHKKAAELPGAVTSAVTACREVCPEVEFVAEDATRADREFVYRMLACAVSAGATTVTLCDSAGVMLPEEFGRFTDDCFSHVPELSREGVTVGISVSNRMNLADACFTTALTRGIGEVKVTAAGTESCSLMNIAAILSLKGESMGVSCGLNLTEIRRGCDAVSALLFGSKSDKSPFEDGVRTVTEDTAFSRNDSYDDVMAAVEKLGYRLGEADKNRVYQAFLRIAARKEKIGLQELEVIIASEAMQVPSVYALVSYVVTAGNLSDAVAHIKLKHKNAELDGVSLGDGPIDAAFLAIEHILGCHYELDDFQIQAITEGREAMGQTLVKLRHAGKIYAGRGLSTDIVGSGIEAYLNALNKIAFEEENP